MASLIANLEAIKSWLKAHYPKSYQAFRPGLSPEKIDKLLKNFDFPGHLPPSVLALYQWHDGLEHNAEFFPGYSFYPLKEALAEYELCQEVSERIQAEHDIQVWKPGWLPVFGFQGDYFMLDCTSENPEPSVYFCAAEDDPYPWFDNLESMCNTLAKAYEIGVFYIDDDLLEADHEALDILRTQWNPQSKHFDTQAEQPQLERKELTEKEDGSKVLTSYYSHDNIVEEYYGPDNRKTGLVQIVQGEVFRRDTWRYLNETEVEIITENLLGMMTTTKTLAKIDAEGHVQTQKIETYLHDLLIAEQDFSEEIQSES